MRWARHVSLTREKRTAGRVLVGKLKEKGQTGSYRLRWVILLK